jgi:hypothetical protein
MHQKFINEMGNLDFKAFTEEVLKHVRVVPEDYGAIGSDDEAIIRDED